MKKTHYDTEIENVFGGAALVATAAGCGDSSGLGLSNKAVAAAKSQAAAGCAGLRCSR